MSFRPFRNAFTPGYLLYAGTIFLGAFLLFAVEPIAGKHLLPWFGGSSSIWATSLLFFTTTLFLGYLYVYLLTRFPEKRQPFIHAIIIVLSLIPAALSLFVWHSLFPSLLWTLTDTEPPSLNVLLALLTSIGMPFLLLATAGPLLQYWRGTSTHKEPYKLYALSNVASLLALVCYPLLIEPHISLHVQERTWMMSFALFAVLYAVVCVRYVREEHHSHEHAQIIAPLGTRAMLLWIALAALPAFLLVATTTQITQVIAPVPLLWIIPLMLYLITFIVAFSGRGQSTFVPLLLLICAALAYRYTSASLYAVLPQLLSDLLLLFFCGLSCHSLLYKMRPATQKLPLFYLLISFGGMLGTLFASLVSPLVFSNFSEFPLGLALSAILAGVVIDESFFPRMLKHRTILLTRIVFACIVATLFFQLILSGTGSTAIASRNFYGNVSVNFTYDGTVLFHGATMHGMQFNDAKRALLPVSYYVPTSGVGRAVVYEESLRGKGGVRAGVIGLGTGTMASYCRPGDAYVFYEIDPRIQILARKYFSYLSHCAGSEVREGDARILLEKELESKQPGNYDLLVVDAFSNDTIPVHLLTKQAVELYAAHLRGPQSIIAIHTSSRYLNLSPIVLRLAAQTGMSAIMVFTDGESSPGGVMSVWVILTKDPSAFGSPAFAHTDTPLPKASDAIWTDDYTALFPVLNVPLRWN